MTRHSGCISTEVEQGGAVRTVNRPFRDLHTDADMMIEIVRNIRIMKERGRWRQQASINKHEQDGVVGFDSL